jgi:hypothetical protein
MSGCSPPFHKEKQFGVNKFILTARSKVILEMLIVAQLVKEFPWLL